MKTVIRWLIACVCVASMAPASLAECIGCTSSHGVRVVRKDGSTVSGYMNWNRFYLGGLRPAEKATSDEESEAGFSEWASLVKAKLSDADYWRGNGIRLRVYRDLHAIKFPDPGYVAIEGEVVDIPWSDVADISPDKGFPLVVSMNAVTVVSRAEADELANEPPRFTVTLEGDVSDATYAVYGSSVSLSALLEHLASDRRGLRVDGLTLGPSTAVDLRAKVGRSEKEEAILRFLDKRESYNSEEQVLSARCEKEYRDLSGGPIPLVGPRQPPKVSDAVLQAKQKECSIKKSKLFRKYWRRLGKHEDLRRLGVIILVTGYD